MTVADLSEGAVIGGCRIESVLGRGGMGVVYRATQVALQRAVAVKVITPDLAEDEEFRSRFQDEWRAAGRLDHPNIVPIYQAGEDAGRLYVVMRLVEGTDLREVMDRERALEPARAIGILAQIARALDEAHASGLVHRDVKPANILIARGRHGGEWAYLTDFGLTKGTTSTAARQTRTGQWVGTPDYIAPEQVEGGKVDARADIYALGCVLFEALTGRLPFDQSELVAKVMARMQGSAPAPSSVNPALAPFDAPLAHALARRPDQRPATAGAMLDEVAAVSAGAGARKPPTPVQPSDATQLGEAGRTTSGRTWAPPPTPPPGPVPPPPSPPYGTPAPAHGPYSSGPASYGPPPVAPAKKSRTGLYAALGAGAGVVVLLLIVLVVALGGSGSKKVDTGAAQADVVSFLKSQTRKDMTVTCPKGVDAKSGGTFDCNGSTPAGDAAVVKVTEDDDSGSRFSEELTKATYDSTYIEQSAKDYYQQQKDNGTIKYLISTVDCPATFEARSGATFECPVTFDDGVKDSFPVTINDVKGDFDIDYTKPNGDLR